VGRPGAYDAMEFDRSVETLRSVADLFVQHHVKAAIEPIRSAEVSFIHTVAEAKRYMAAVNHPGVRHINGDVYHMQVEQSHIGEALLEAGEMLVNLHFAESNRCAIGEGALDVDTIIRALYVLGYNTDGKYVTFEPLGPGSDPYPAMYGKPNPAKLDPLVFDSIRYFHEREEVVLAN
jgi:sugar phosphate isomerase/epimerase